jgi:hypothetical protein
MAFLIEAQNELVGDIYIGKARLIGSDIAKKQFSNLQFCRLIEFDKLSQPEKGT